MENFLKTAQDQLIHGIFPDLRDELALFELLLSEAGPERIELVKLVFQESRIGFVGTRTSAGLILYAENPEEFWKIVNDLTKSVDLDDRDTAFSSLCRIHNPTKYVLIRPFLHDDYLRFDAVDFFIENKLYLAEVEEVLFQLVVSDDPKIASRVLDRLGFINAEKNKNWKANDSYIPMRTFYSFKDGTLIQIEAQFLNRLVTAIKLIASDFEQQCTYISPFAFMPDEIALAFDEAFQFVDQVVGAKLVNEAQISAVEAIHHCLSHLRQNKQEWTQEAIRTSPAWQQLRLLGKNALLLFEQSDN